MGCCQISDETEPLIPKQDQSIIAVNTLKNQEKGEIGDLKQVYWNQQEMEVNGKPGKMCQFGLQLGRESIEGIIAVNDQGSALVIENVE